jgi:hypothetical protein
MKPRVYLVVATFLFLLAARPFARAQTRATVVGITGQWWKMPAQQQLHFASELPVPKGGLEVACDKGSLVLKIAETATSFACDADRRTDKCPLPAGAKYCLTLRFATSSNWNLAFAGPLIDYVVPVSRGLESQLKEAVVPLAGDRVDISAVFQDVDSGSYRVRFESVSGGMRTPTLQVDWTKGTSVSVTIPGVTAGLYKLQLLDGNGQQTGSDAKVLINEPEDFKKNRAAFQEALDATKKWPDEVDARAPRAFLRQVLDGLSRQDAR